MLATRPPREREELEMTAYRKGDLSEEYEFKIIRSATGGFRRPEQLQQILAEESCAGWTLVEKFDDYRIRVKRPGSARDRDAALDFDPYRTWVGASEIQMAAALGAVCLLVLAVVVAVLALSGGSLPFQGPAAVPPGSPLSTVVPTLL
jgi:hypothetical protein